MPTRLTVVEDIEVIRAAEAAKAAAAAAAAAAAQEAAERAAAEEAARAAAAKAAAAEAERQAEATKKAEEAAERQRQAQAQQAEEEKRRREEEEAAEWEHEEAKRRAADEEQEEEEEEEEICYENGEPTYEGNRVTKCFKNRGNGLLFRVINDKEFRWAFYNDLTDYNMVVTCVFGSRSHVRPLGKTTATKNPSTGEATLVVEVGPVATEMFMDGVPKGAKMSFEARPIPREECLKKHLKITQGPYTTASFDGTESGPSARNSMSNRRSSNQAGRASVSKPERTSTEPASRASVQQGRGSTVAAAAS